MQRQCDAAEVRGRPSTRPGNPWRPRCASSGRSWRSGRCAGGQGRNGGLFTRNLSCPPNFLAAAVCSRRWQALWIFQSAWSAHAEELWWKARRWKMRHVQPVWWNFDCLHEHRHNKLEIDNRPSSRPIPPISTAGIAWQERCRALVADMRRMPSRPPPGRWTPGSGGVGGRSSSGARGGKAAPAAPAAAGRWSGRTGKMTTRPSAEEGQGWGREGREAFEWSHVFLIKPD